MLSLGSREDARKGVAFGPEYGGGGGMEGNEVEEGEACSSQEDETIIDPDIALSYIDEKVQDILGHFQKDFEGGLSAENLGSKFGGYGSFLPTYPRSPSIRSHSKSPVRVPNHNNPISPDTPPTEGANHKSPVPVSTSVPMKNYSVAAALQLDDTKRNENSISSPNFGEFAPQNGMINKLSKHNDQKIPKVRIKVCPENILPRPNAAIYSDMGLDYSPSSSLEDSPNASEGFSLETQDLHSESPMSVLKIMTCFPIAGGYVLSPLSEHVLHLMENVRPYLRDCKSGTSIGVETKDVMKSEMLPTSNGKVLLGRKVKNTGKNMKSLEIEDLNCNADTNNGTDVEMRVAKMPVFDALSTPIRSTSGDAGGNTESQPLEAEMKGSSASQEPDKVLVKDREPSCDLSEEELLDGMPGLHAGKFDIVGNDYPHLKGKLEFESCSSDKVLEEGKLNNHKGAQLDLHDKGRGAAELDLQNKGRGRAEQGCDAFNSAVGTSKARKALQKSTLNGGEGEKMLQARDHSSGMKRKTKGSDGMSCADNSKESIKVAFSLSSKEKQKNSHSNRDHSEDKQNVLKSHESSRILNKEFIVGGTKDETLEYGSDLSKNIFRDKTKDSMIGNEKDAFAFVEKAKKKLTVKNVEKPQISEALRKGLYVSPSVANGSTSDAAPVPSSHVVIQENWVCCDKCHTWRLLPYWTDPGQLPNKWLCTMLNWLPGMNKCSFSEEETTIALHALYQASLLENQTAVTGPNSEIAAGAVSTSVQNVVQNHISSLHMASSYDKKKNTPKDVPCQGMQLCQSDKKNQHVSMKSRGSCQNQVETNVSSKSFVQPVNKSTELNVEKVDGRQKKKHKKMERYSTGGEFIDQKDQLSKSKNKRGSDQDGLRNSKIGKTEEACNGDKAWHRDGNLTKSLSFMNGSSLSPSKVTAKSVLGYTDYSSSKDSKCNSKDSLSGSRSKSKASIKVSLNGISKGHFSTSNVEKYDKEDSSANKRKVKQQQECQVPPEAMVLSGILVDDRANIKEGTSENKSRKAKRARISRTEERETFPTMMDGKIHKKGQVVRVLLSSRKECPLDGMASGKKGLENEQQAKYLDSVESEPNMDCSGSKRDLSYVQTFTTATSSSSKVSGTSKNKCNFQEVRGSPVESVSSSPLRISNVGKFGSEKNTVGRDDPVQASLSMFGSSRRSSDGEVSQIDQHATIRRDKPSSVVHIQSLGGYPDVEFEVTEPAKGAADCLDREASSLSVDKAKDGMHLKPSGNFNIDSLVPEFDDNNLVASDNIQGKNCRHDPEKQKGYYYSSCCDQQKSCKNSLLQTKDKRRSSKSDVGKHKVSDVDKHKVRASDRSSEKEDACPIKNGDRFRNDADVDPLNPCCHEDLGNEKGKGVEKDKKKESMGKCLSERRRVDNLNFAATDNLDDNNLLAKQHRDLNSRVSETGRDSTKKVKSLHDNSQKRMCYEDKRLSDHLNPDQTQKLEMTETEKSQHLPHSGDNLPSSQDPQTVLPNAKLGRSEMSSVDVMIGDASKVLKQRKLDCQNGTQHSNLVHLIGNGFDTPSPARQDRNHPAANVVLKEARHLKHTANRLKSEGQEYESTGLYFEAALKFLHVASLLESSSAESGKHVESTQSMIMYSETAKLCQFCAHEYEKWQEMAAIALAYKCVEVAFMKAVFLKSSLASKDRHELLIALQVVPSGESPSSSSSDIDNVNNQSTVDNAGSIKAVNSPQMSGAHVITARSYQIIGRLLNYSEDMNYAMDASKKSRAAFRAANDAKKSSCGPEGIVSVRKVLDFSFNDVEGFLHLVRLSINSISH